MPTIQTDAGRAFAAQEEAAQRTLVISTVKFAHPTFADPDNPPTPDPAMTAQTSVVYTGAVSGVGKIDPDNVAYSIFLDTTVGNFTFGQVGYYALAPTGSVVPPPGELVLMLVSNLPPVVKRKNDVGQTGNNYKHTAIRQYANAAVAADVTIPPETWQLDFTALLALKQYLAAKGQVNGYASLDGAGDVPDTQIPPPYQRVQQSSYQFPDAGTRWFKLATLEGIGRLFLSCDINNYLGNLLLLFNATNYRGDEPTSIPLWAVQSGGIVNSPFVNIHVVDTGLWTSPPELWLEAAGNAGTVLRLSAESRASLDHNVSRSFTLVAQSGAPAGIAASYPFTPNMNGFFWLQGGELYASGRDALLRSSKRNAANGVAPLGSDGKVPDANIQAGIQRKSEKSAANGYASLDAAGHVPLAEIPPALQGAVGGAGGLATLDADTELAQNVKASHVNTATPFPGTPNAATAAPGTNNTQLATTAFVTAAVNALINGAPGALDTLLELAAAMGDDPNFATTITNALALKAPLDSPVLTGNPTAPTQAQANNSTKLATTAYVDAGLSPKAPLASPALTGNPTAPTQTAGDNSTKLATTAFVETEIANGQSYANPWNHIGGLGLSTAGDSTTLTVAQGAAMDSGNAQMLKRSGSSMTKVLNVGLSDWTAGSGQNGLAKALSRQNNAWYHVFALGKTSDKTAFDIGFDTSIIAANLMSGAAGEPGAAGWNLFRRIGSIRTDGSGNITAFNQYGDYFAWNAFVFDENAVNPGDTNAHLITYTVPPGVKVMARLIVECAMPTGNTALFSDPDISDQAPSSTNGNAFGITGVSNPMQLDVMTNASAQVRVRQTGINLRYVYTVGWFDVRGKHNTV